jgi:hypothetical protein
VLAALELVRQLREHQHFMLVAVVAGTTKAVAVLQELVEPVGPVLVEMAQHLEPQEQQQVQLIPGLAVVEVLLGLQRAGMAALGL